jgi:hypothetical protein
VADEIFKKIKEKLHENGGSITKVSPDEKEEPEESPE